jgi:hypothetical protein
MDDIFRYGGGIVVHPIVFRSQLGHERNIVEYQVRQTASGAEISICTLGPVDTEALARATQLDLAAAGLRDARISIRAVDSLDRQQTGKLKRFISLS